MNLRPPVPQTGALTGLRHAPTMIELSISGPVFSQYYRTGVKQIFEFAGGKGALGLMQDFAALFDFAQKSHEHIIARHICGDAELFCVCGVFT